VIVDKEFICLFVAEIAWLSQTKKLQHFRYPIAAYIFI